MAIILSTEYTESIPLLSFILIFSQCPSAGAANTKANERKTSARKTRCCRSFTHCGSLTLLFSVVQTYIDIGIARGVVEGSSRRQNAPRGNVAEVSVSAGSATPRYVQVFRSAGSGERSMDTSHSHQHT